MPVDNYYQISLPGNMTLKLKVADPSKDAVVYLLVEHGGHNVSFTYTATNPGGSRIAVSAAGTAAGSRSIGSDSVKRLKTNVRGADIVYDDPAAGPGGTQH